MVWSIMSGAGTQTQNSTDYTKARPTRGTYLYLACAVLASFLVEYRCVHNIARTAQMVSHTNEVKAEIYALESGVKDVQRRVRGFIITHQPQSLDPYDVGLKSTQEHFDRLTTTNAQVDAISSILTEMLDEENQLLT